LEFKIMLDYSRYSESGTAPSFAEKVPGPGILPFLSVWSPMSDKLGALNSKARHTGEELAQGWLKFIGDRMSKDIAFPEQLAACKTANDVYLAYSQFWQQAAKDYATEFTAITDAFWNVIRSPLETAESNKNKANL
jgi:hypothetical protein